MVMALEDLCGACAGFWSWRLPFTVSARIGLYSLPSLAGYPVSIVLSLFAFFGELLHFRDTA